jgi:drug/metabolite transporter (DMT)-like permease
VSNRWLPLAAIGLSVLLWSVAYVNYGAERLPAAVSGIATAAIPALGCGFALLLGEPLDPIKGSGLAEPADLATGPMTQVNSPGATITTAEDA